jgi:hypothetical protein
LCIAASCDIFPIELTPENKERTNPEPTTEPDPEPIPAPDPEPVTVEPASVSLLPSNIKMNIGDVDFLIATVLPGNAVQDVTWTSNNADVAEVGQDGKITAKREGTATVTARTVNGKTASCAITVNSGIPNTVKTVLGYGYDITGRYAYSPDVKLPVLDLNKLLAARMVKEDPNLRYGDFETVAGKDINEYTREITANVSYSIKANLKKVVSFTSEVGANFNNNRIEKGEYAFATSTSRIITGAYNIPEKDGLYTFLTQSFINDLETMSNDQIINKYGTHIMLGAVLGARADYNLSVRKKTQNDITNLSAYVKAKAEGTYKGITGESGYSADGDARFTQYFYTDTADTKTRVFGGIVQYGQYINDKQDYDKWLGSIEGNEIWVDYYPKSLIPVSDLIADKNRSDDLSQAIYDYCESKGIRIDPFNPLPIPKIDPFYSEKLDANLVNKDDETWNIRSYFNISNLKSSGYTKLNITLRYDAEVIISTFFNGCYIRGEIGKSSGEVYDGRTDSNQGILKWNTYEISKDVPLDNFDNNLVARWSVQKGATYNIKNRKITIKAIQ